MISKPYQFCTLFNINYYARGIAMYRSLKRECSDFHLYILAFDDAALRALEEANLEDVTVIPLSEFEDVELLAVKEDRTAAEYCWTATPSIILYCIDTFGLDHCTYIDADLYFYASPAPLFDEIADASVCITEHRYTEEYDFSKTAGKYCVQFITFTNDKEGRKVLTWWRDACLEWCYARVEDNKYGDQKYLDDWTERFDNVHECKHLGAGVAPWNVQQYVLQPADGKMPSEQRIPLQGKVIKTGETFPLIFYHFHKVQVVNNRYVYISEYPVSRFEKEYLYGPYCRELFALQEEYEAVHGSKIRDQNETLPGSKQTDNVLASRDLAPVGVLKLYGKEFIKYLFNTGSPSITSAVKGKRRAFPVLSIRKEVFRESAAPRIKEENKVEKQPWPGK